MQRKWCSEFDFKFERKPFIGTSYQKELCEPALPIVQPHISETSGNCVFSSVYYLITGKKSGHAFFFEFNGM